MTALFVGYVSECGRGYLMDKVLIIGENRIQYDMAKTLAERDFAIFYYGVMSYEKPKGVKLVKDVDLLRNLLADPTCLTVLPIELHIGEKENVEAGQPALLILENNNLIDRAGHGLTQKCKFWSPDADAKAKRKLAQLLSEAAIVEGKLLLGKAISQTRALVIGFDVYAEQIARRLRDWECDVTVMPDDEMEYQLAAYRKYTVCEKNRLETVQGETGKRLELVYQCSGYQILTGKEMGFLSDNAVILNLTDKGQAVDMKYAARNHICVKHANHLLLEYASVETGRILAEAAAELIEKEKR